MDRTAEERGEEVTGTIDTPFNCGTCGPRRPGLEPLGNGTVARYCSNCGTTYEEFDGTPAERLDAAERAYKLALDDLRNDRFDDPPAGFDELGDADKAHLRATLRLARYDNAAHELNEAREANGLGRLLHFELEKEYA
jgi:hypothetical protein